MSIPSLELVLSEHGVVEIEIGRVARRRIHVHRDGNGGQGRVGCHQGQQARQVIRLLIEVETKVLMLLQVHDQLGMMEVLIVRFQHPVGIDQGIVAILVAVKQFSGGVLVNHPVVVVVSAIPDIDNEEGV